MPMATDSADPLFLVEFFREFYAAVLHHRTQIESAGAPVPDEDSVEIREADILANKFRLDDPRCTFEAADLIRSIKGYRLLQGYRGHPPADVDAIQELLLRLSRLVEEVPEIVELDLNPIFALAPGEGYRIVDARIRVGGKNP